MPYLFCWSMAAIADNRLDRKVLFNFGNSVAFHLGVDSQWKHLDSRNVSAVFYLSCIDTFRERFVHQFGLLGHNSPLVRGIPRIYSYRQKCQNTYSESWIRAAQKNMERGGKA